MPVLPFLSGATGDPINLQRQIIGQPTRGLPLDLSLATWRDFRSNGGPISFSTGRIPRAVIAAGGQPQGDLTGKFTVEPITLPIGDLDPANRGILHLLANFFELYDDTDKTTYREWLFARDATTTADAFSCFREWNDVIMGMRIADMKISGFELSTSPNENLQISFNGSGVWFDFHGIVSQETGAGSTLPVFRRIWGDKAGDSGNFALDATDQDLFLRIDQATDIDISGKVTTAAAYSNTQLNEVLGNWHRFYDQAGAAVGKWAEQIEYFLPTGATLVALDVFKVLKRMTKWSPSLAADRPITSVNAFLFLDGVEQILEGGFTVSMSRDGAFRPGVSGRQGGTSRASGDWVAEITLNRDVVDLEMQEAIINSTQRSIVIDARTDVEISGASRPYKVLFIFPKCTPFGTTFGPDEGGENREESVLFVAEQPDSAFVYDTYTVNAHANVIVENDLTGL